MIASANRFFSRFFPLMLALLITFFSGVLLAQGTSATVTGFVNDPSGAKLPGVAVVYTNADTGVVGRATTNAAGLYRITGLLPGNYRSTATLTGFKTAVREGIDVKLEDQLTIDYVLDIGSTSETVTVESTNSVLETSSPTVSQVIEGRQVEDTPLNGRNALNLVALTPGVVAQGSTSGAASNNSNGGSFTNANGFANYSIAGGLANQGSTYIDGSPINILQGHPIAYVPVQDSVQEFRVETSVVNPQYGEFSGGVISFATKSGTNKLHGSLYEYLRNTALNANTFFNNAAGQPRPSFNQNQYGGTIGGKLITDKAFFFISYEGFRQAQGVPNAGRVPTPAELSGDFRADPKIIDPVGVPNAAGTAVTYSQLQCNGVLNVLCASAAVRGPNSSPSVIDPTSNYIANVAKYFPAPNTTTGGAGINFLLNGKAAATNNNYDARLDYNLGSKQKLFFKYARLDRYQQGTQYLNNPSGPNSGTSVGADLQHFVVGDTIVLNSTSVVQINASYLRYFSFLLPTNTNVNLAAFGPFWAAAASEFTFREFPNITITNNIPQPFGQLDNTAFQRFNNDVISGSYSKVLGRHALTFGGEARRREEYFNNIPDPSGLFVFAGTATACIPSPPVFNAQGGIATPGKVCASGVVVPGSGATPVADFLTGVITTAPLGFTSFNFPSAVNHYDGVFANDTYQVSPRLILTAGLRYELPGGFVEKKDRNAVLLPQLANPLVLVNSGAYPSRSDLQGHYHLFSPRVGFSFSPYTGTTVRAGYSLAFLPEDTVFNSGPAGSPINTPVTFVPPGTRLSAPLGGTAAAPRTTILQPIGRGYANNPSYFFGQVINGRVPNSPFPYLQQWNANVQQSLNKSTVLQLAYLGARGDHLPIYGSIDLNQLPDRYDGVSPGLLNQSLRPYPTYQNVNQYSPYVGDSYYHSAQVTVSKRFAGGGTLLGNYSWSKFLGNSESTNAPVEVHTQGVIQDYTNLRAEKSYLSFDAPQHLVVSYIVDLPVGKGKRFLSNNSDFVNRLVSGFNAAGINTFQSGYPLAIVATANTLSNVYGAGTIRPNVVPGCNKSLGGSLVAHAQAGTGVLNAACFTPPGTTSFGNQPRTDGSLRDQGIDNWDFSIGKTTQIHENINLVFRAEAFNVFNRVQFGDPNLNSSSSLFGVITTQVNSPRSFQFSLRVNY